jgi:hypothetical protein
MADMPALPLLRRRAFPLMLVVLLALLPALLSPGRAGAQGTLNGETLTGDLQAEPALVEECYEPGAVIPFRSEGVAAGPFAGTYVEEGAITILDATSASFQSVFTIAGTRTITGAKGGTVAIYCGVPVPDLLQFSVEGTVSYQSSLGDSGQSLVRGEFVYDRDNQVVVVNVFNETFVATTAVTVILTPFADANPVGTHHTVTATVLDGAGQPVADATVEFRVTGSVVAQGRCTTDQNGQCTFTYQGPALPGADLITAFVDNDDSGDVGPGDAVGEATKAWILPASTPGHVTGGGQINKNLVMSGVVFGFNARSTLLSASGHCNVVDRTADTHVKCLDVTAMVVTPTHATIFGNATVNGQPATYRIDVDDVAEPGRFRDTFSILTVGLAPGASYQAAGVLTQGNIQIHRR